MALIARRFLAALVAGGALVGAFAALQLAVDVAADTTTPGGPPPLVFAFVGLMLGFGGLWIGWLILRGSIGRGPQT
jgi:hypothetical protein